MNRFQFKVFPMGRMIFLNCGQFLPISREMFPPLATVTNMTRFAKVPKTCHRSIILMLVMVWVAVFAWWSTQASQAMPMRRLPAESPAYPTGQGYLKVVGPPPLRFEPPDTNTLVMLKAVMQMPKLMVTEAANLVPTNAETQATNPVATSVTAEIGMPAISANPVPEIDAVTNQAVTVEAVNTGSADGVNNISGDGSSSARDLLPVAASMITEYLKPTKQNQTTNQADQPGATVFVPLQMGFTPPVMQSSGTAPESRAVYKSQ
jgi:hypothetical protein